MALISDVTSAHVGSGEPKSITVPIAEVPPILDGKLDDHPWREAAIIEDLQEVSPNEFAPPSRATRIYVAYDTEELYVAARLYEDSPDEINTLIIKQSGILDDDRFAVMVDAFNAGRSGYIFELNTQSVRNNALFQNVTVFGVDFRYLNTRLPNGRTLEGAA